MIFWGLSGFKFQTNPLTVLIIRLFNIAMAQVAHVELIYLSEMVIFYSDVRLPQGGAPVR